MDQIAALAFDPRPLWRKSPFIWGQTDCIMATCNYIRDRTGIDPAAPWRWSYDSAEAAQALWEPWGGVLGLFDHGMARAGFKRAVAPAFGLPVVCDFGGHEIAGVYIGPITAFMADGRGCIETRATVLGVWQI